MKKTTATCLLLGWLVASSPSGYAQSDPPTRRLPLSQARTIALRKAPGKVRDFEFEVRKNKWVYYFKIAGKDQKWHFISVDAVTGKIVSKIVAPMPVKTPAPPVPSPSAEPSTQK